MDLNDMEVAVAEFMSFSGMEGLRKTARNLSKDSPFLGRNLNPGPPEYEAGVLTTRLAMSGQWYLFELRTN
jgi:hypothetical protein